MHINKCKICNSDTEFRISFSGNYVINCSDCGCFYGITKIAAATFENLSDKKLEIEKNNINVVIPVFLTGGESVTPLINSISLDGVTLDEFWNKSCHSITDVRNNN